MSNIIENIAFVSCIAVTVLWYYYILERENHSFLRLLIFPISNKSNILSFDLFPAGIPIVFCYLITLQDISTLIADRDPLVFLISVCISTLFIVFYPLHWLFKFNKIFNILYFAVSVAIVGFFGYLTYYYKNFEIWNNFDFVVQIVTLCISLYVISRVIIKDLFVEKLIDFFVFTGLIIYSFLQIVATIMMKFGFSENFNFATIASFSTMIFWIISVPWILRLKSKLS